MFDVVNQLLDKGGAPSVLPDSDDMSSGESLSIHFTEKSEKIQESFSSTAASAVAPWSQLLFFFFFFSGQLLSQCLFRLCNCIESNQTDQKYQRQVNSTVDPMSARMVVEHLNILLHVIVELVNGSL